MTTMVVAGATAVCGLLLLGGVSPEPASGDVLPFASPGPDDPATTTTETAPTSTSPPTTTTDAPSPTSTTTSPPTSTTTSPPTSTSTTTTTTLPASTTIAPLASVIPLAVDVASPSVGIGGVATFTGTCDTVGGRPAGAVVVDVVGDATQRITTGIVAERWDYEWTAPTDTDLIRSYVFQFWCGDPGSATTGYPLSLQRTVDIVASAPSPPAPGGSDDPDEPAPVIPVTG